MKNIARALAMLSQIGISMLVPIFLCMLLGNWLDKKFGTSPWLLVIFIILGVGAAFRTLYMMTVYTFKKNSDDDDDGGGDESGQRKL